MHITKMIALGAAVVAAGVGGAKVMSRPGTPAAMITVYKTPT